MYKEIVDNLRDKQTFFYALLFGPVLLPLLIGGSLVASFKQFSIDFDEVTQLAVVNAEAAPNLMEFLHTHNVDVVTAPEDVEAAVRSGDLDIALEIPDEFGTQLRAALPAPLTLYVNDADKDSARAARKINALIDGYKNTLNSLRMQHRGIDPQIFNAIDLTKFDVSEDGSSGQLMASILPFLFIISMTMGGFYLAIDTTAGERERQSLEPLLALPLDRADIVYGKFGATMCFVLMSTVLTACSIYGLFQLFPTELISGGLRFDGVTLFSAFLLVSPLVFFISAVLITVSAYTRSTKEAQTYLGLLMVIPMAPFFLLQFFSLSASSWSMFLPMLSQYQLLEKVVLQDEITSWNIVLSVGGTLLAGLLLLRLATTLYKRDRILM
jgi:sodium transport system permease protein